jgi:hypothetical protein
VVRELVECARQHDWRIGAPLSAAASAALAPLRDFAIRSLGGDSAVSSRPSVEPRSPLILWHPALRVYGCNRKREQLIKALRPELPHMLLNVAALIPVASSTTCQRGS